MKRSSLGVGGALLLLLISLSGCAQLFEFNLFRSLDPVPLPTSEELNAMSEDEALGYLQEELASPVFVEKLLEDEATFAAVDGILVTSMTGSSDADNRKRAAVLYADLHLAGSGAGEAVNDLSQLMNQDVTSLEFSDEAAVIGFLQELLPQIVPPEALASQAAFDALLTGFQEAWAGYLEFAAALGDPPEVPEGVNLGDVAQKALFSFLVTEALRAESLYSTEEEARAALWDAARGVVPATPAYGGFADPFVTGTPLQNILDAAGISC